MSPERWRVVDAILRGALAGGRARRDDFVHDACGEDEALRREVESLLAAQDGMAHDFLEQPAVEALVGTPTATLDEQRTALLADALAGRYVIEREIARGGMAAVYRARDVRHGRRVGIKVMRDEVAAVVGAERFLQEIRVLASLQHPHIVPLFDSGQTGTLLWYVMPFIEGETLRSRLSRNGRLSVGEAMRLARQVADALEYAHARGIVHRDIKPENVLLQGDHALVADFGIALALEQAGSERLTRTGLTLGTPQYMAPEQAAGERAVDARADVYALGAVTYEMLTGEPPFTARSRQAVVHGMLGEQPMALAACRADVSPSLDAVVGCALAKRPDERFPSAAAFAAALIASDSALAAETAARRKAAVGGSDAPAAPPVGRAVATRAAVYAAIAGIAVGVLAGVSVGRSPILKRWGKSSSPIAQPAAVPVEVGAPAELDVPVVVAAASAPSLAVVDRTGHVQHAIPADRPWTPRFSPDGRSVAYGAFGAGRSTSDLWVTSLDAGTTQRLTNDDGDSNDPQWSPDGTWIAYSANAPGGKDVATRRVAGGAAHVVAARRGTQFPSDWLRDGSALIVTENGPGRHDIIVQPTDGSPARPYAATGANERAGRVSPDGRWIAYVSDESGRAAVYLDSYPRAGRRVMVSRGEGEGVDPVWRGDGRELYYWRGDDLVAVPVDAAANDALPAIGAAAVLFRAPYQVGLNTMYDATADGRRFVIVQRR